MRPQQIARQEDIRAQREMFQRKFRRRAQRLALWFIPQTLCVAGVLVLLVWGFAYALRGISNGMIW